MTDLTPLPRVAAKIREMTGSDDISYSRLYRATLDGRFPTVLRNGRHFVKDADLPAVAAAFGLKIVAAIA